MTLHYIFARICSHIYQRILSCRLIRCFTRLARVNWAQTRWPGMRSCVLVASRIFSRYLTPTRLSVRNPSRRPSPKRPVVITRRHCSTWVSLHSMKTENFHDANFCRQWRRPWRLLLWHTLTLVPPLPTKLVLWQLLVFSVINLSMVRLIFLIFGFLEMICFPVNQFAAKYDDNYIQKYTMPQDLSHSARLWLFSQEENTTRTKRRGHIVVRRITAVHMLYWVKR